MRRLAVALTLWLLTGCSAVLDTGTGRRPSLISQVSEHDCAVAAIAMLTDHSYAATDKERRRMHIPIEHGMVWSDAVLLIKMLGGAVVAERLPNPAMDEGIVVVGIRGGTTAHAVYLFHAYVYDPADGTSPTPYVLAATRWEHIDYFLRRIGTPR